MQGSVGSLDAFDALNLHEGKKKPPEGLSQKIIRRGIGPFLHIFGQIFYQFFNLPQIDNLFFSDGFLA